MPNAKHGITLVALVITIIILLILAGTAISLSTNGSNLFSKTTEASENWNQAVNNENNSLTSTLEVLDMAANPELAKSQLIVKVNSDETVESPYYVNYPSAKGTIKCRVLYNDSRYGLQIVSVNPVTSVVLGKDDSNENVVGQNASLERAKNSYNRAILTLNEKAEEYIETIDGSILATDARCIGSDPINKNHPDNLTGDLRTSEMFVAENNDSNLSSLNYQFFKTDNHYQTDYTRLEKIGAKEVTDASAIIKSYWIASREIIISGEYVLFCVHAVNTENGYSNYALWYIISNNEGANHQPGLGLRPVFILSPEVKIIGGEGTAEVPFEIGL